MRIEQAIEIERPPEDVFAVLTDPDRLADWQTSTIEVQRDAAGPLTVGERFHEVHAGPFGRHVSSTLEVSERRLKTLLESEKKTRPCLQHDTPRAFESEQVGPYHPKDSDAASTRPRLAFLARPFMIMPC